MEVMDDLRRDKNPLRTLEDIEAIKGLHNEYSYYLLHGQWREITDCASRKMPMSSFLDTKNARAEKKSIRYFRSSYLKRIREMDEMRTSWSCRSSPWMEITPRWTGCCISLLLTR
jgi:hypothetical protein